MLALADRVDRQAGSVTRASRLTFALCTSVRPPNQRVNSPSQLLDELLVPSRPLFSWWELPRSSQKFTLEKFALEKSDVFLLQVSMELQAPQTP
jgi:hypothetical protein